MGRFFSALQFFDHLLRLTALLARAFPTSCVEDMEGHELRAGDENMEGDETRVGDDFVPTVSVAEDMEGIEVRTRDEEMEGNDCRDGDDALVVAVSGNLDCTKETEVLKSPVFFESLSGTDSIVEQTTSFVFATKKVQKRRRESLKIWKIMCQGIGLQNLLPLMLQDLFCDLQSPKIIR